MLLRIHVAVLKEEVHMTIAVKLANARRLLLLYMLRDVTGGGRLFQRQYLVIEEEWRELLKEES